MTIQLKSAREIAAMRESGRLVAELYQALDTAVKPGVRLKELDQLAETLLRERGAEPLYKGYKGSQANHPPFPGVICASVNNEICHGLPNGRVLKEGDIVGIDVGLKYKGWCGDACVTYGVGQLTPQTQRLLDVARESLNVGIGAAQAGGFLGDIGRAINDYADKQRVSVVREWGGHGIGKVLHEPLSVLHIRQPHKGPELRPGMTFTIEPMLNLGKPDWVLLPDGWTVVTKDGSLSAQFEHTIAITPHGPEILTLL
ncbi:MAG: type I methionyl aminopeptidase [Anaerolineae bacterium]